MKLLMKKDLKNMFNIVSQQCGYGQVHVDNPENLHSCISIYSVCTSLYVDVSPKHTADTMLYKFNIGTYYIQHNLQSVVFDRVIFVNYKEINGQGNIIPNLSLQKS